MSDSAHEYLLSCEVDRLTNRLEVIERDAARYRWLRDGEYSAKIWEELSHNSGMEFELIIDSSMMGEK